MRIIGEIKHPNYKITVFEMNQRLSLQIENDGLQQLYKLPDGIVSHYSDVVNLVDDLFLLRVQNIFKHMYAARNEGIATLDSAEDHFPEII